MRNLRKIGTEFGLESCLEVMRAKSGAEMKEIICNASWELLPFVDCFLKLITITGKRVTLSADREKETITVVIDHATLGQIKASAPTLEAALNQFEVLIKKP